MTAYEIISIFLGILTLLFTFGSLIVALLALSLVCFGMDYLFSRKKEETQK